MPHAAAVAGRCAQTPCFCCGEAARPPVPVLAPGQEQTRTGRLWTYVRDDRPWGEAPPPAVWFAYPLKRRGEHPQAHLKNLEGVLQADAFAEYAPLYASGKIREAACWAHVQRQFYDWHKAQASPLTGEALQRMGALYAIEHEIRGQPPDLRHAGRQARAGPLLNAWQTWMQATLRQLSKKSALAETIRYALVRWEALVRYVGDGRIEIDNNTAERALRAATLGRKNYLFAGSDEGGEQTATIYSLIGTAKLNASIPKPTCDKSSAASPSIRSTPWPICCLGISPLQPQHLTTPPPDPFYSQYQNQFKTVPVGRLPLKP